MNELGGVLKDDPDRQRFVIKVYAIVTAQLGLTASMSAGVYMSESAKDFVRQYYFMTYVTFIFSIAISCSFRFCLKNARKVPINYILLLLFTICWSYMVASFTQWFEGP